MFLQRKHLGCPRGLYKDTLSLDIENKSEITIRQDIPTKTVRDKITNSSGCRWEHGETEFQSLFFGCDKAPWSRQTSNRKHVIRGLLTVSEGESRQSWCRTWEQAGDGRAESSLPDTKAGDRKTEPRVGFRNPKAHHTVTCPPTRPHLLPLLKHFHILENKYQILEPIGPFSIKPPQTGMVLFCCW